MEKKIGKYIYYSDGSAPKRWYDNKQEYVPIKVGLGAGTKGYKYKRVTVDGKLQYLHRLLYQVFVGEIPKGMTVDFIDNDRFNVAIDNLRLLTQSENSRKGMNNTWKVNREGITNGRGKHIVCNETGQKFRSISDCATTLAGNSLTNKKLIGEHLKDKSKVPSVRGLTFNHLNQGGE